MMDYPISITFTLGSLIKMIYSVLGVVALAYIVLILKNIYLILKNHYEVLKNNADSIDSLIKDSSEIIHNFNNVTTTLPQKVNNIADDFKNNFSLLNLALSSILGFKKKKEN